MQRPLPTPPHSPPAAGNARSQYGLPLLVLAICLTCVVFAWHRQVEGDLAVERERMERRADSFAVKLLERLRAYEQVLRGAAGVFAATPSVTRESWRRYVTRQELERTYPSILAVGYSPRVTAENLASHAARVRAEGFPDYTVHPVGARSEAFPIEFVEPFTGRNLRAFGYDMFSEASRREAMSRARDTGAPALSGRVTLLQDDTGRQIPGFLLYVPIFRGGETPLTLRERRERLSGFVYSAYFASELFSHLVDWEGDGLMVSVHDGRPGEPNGFLYSSGDAALPATAEQVDHPELLRVIEAGGRKLTIQLHVQPDASAHQWWAAMEVWLGFAVSLLLAGVVLLATQTRRRAEAIAAERTEELQRRSHELESSRNLLDAVINSVPVVVSVKDQDFRIALINSESERFHGVKDRAYLGKTDYELFPAEQAERIRAQDVAIMASGEPLTIEEAFVAASGAPRWVIKRKVAVPLPSGGIGVLTTLFDITDRRASEVALRESEERWSSVFETAGEGILVIDERGLIDSANGAACSIFGYERSEIIGIDVRRLMTEDHHAILDARSDEGMRSRVTGRRRDGAFVAVEWSLREFRLGSRAMRTAIVSDLTALVRQQAISRRTEEVADVGGWELEFATGKVFWTEQTYRIHGVPLGEPEPALADAFDFYAPEARPRLQAAVARSIACGEPWDYTVELLPRGGGRKWIRSVGQVEVRDGQPIRAFGAFQDVTRIKEAEDEIRRHRDTLQETVEARTADLRMAMEAAERANRAKSDFLANMSHELRTPMHAVLSFAKLGGAKASADTSEGSNSRRYFGRILESGERLLRLVDDLLDLSKMEAGRMTYDLGAHDLAEVATGVVTELEEMARTRGVRLECFTPEGRFLARIDRDRMAQVLRNLLSNALRYTPAGKSVRVEIESVSMCLTSRRDVSPGPSQVLRVVDEGVGIPDGELDSIFEKFVQSSKTKSGAGGTGLGLPICREIVEAHGGEIFASHAPGGGAVLTVILPTMATVQRPECAEGMVAQGAVA